MSVQYSPDLAALADRPDFEVSLPEEPRPGVFRRARRAAVAVALFLAVTFALAVVFYIPVFVYNLSQIDALEIAGRLVPASVFAEHFSALFWGTFVLALAVTSFVASLLLFASGRIVRPCRRRFRREDALTHLAVLRLAGPER
jgi:hypothetical protein